MPLCKCKNASQHLKPFIKYKWQSQNLSATLNAVRKHTPQSLYKYALPWKNMQVFPLILLYKHSVLLIHLIIAFFFRRRTKDIL